MKTKYPPNWDDIRQAAYERAGWRCEHCGMEFAAGTTKALSGKNKNGDPIILTVHHIDGNTTNNDWRNLLACCQICHLHIQGTWKPGQQIPLEWYGVPHWLLERELTYWIQLELIPREE